MNRATVHNVLAESAGGDPSNVVMAGATQPGLLGSSFYVNGLRDEDRARIALYLNIDTLGSPNFVSFVYDGDDSDAVGAGPGPDGSAAIEQTFQGFYDSRGVPYKGEDFTGRSDYNAFIAVGIPSGGVFTGAEFIKTPDAAALWGGVAGKQYDPCFNLVCDTYDNVSLEALDLNADAVAYAVLKYEMSTVDVNGMKGRGNSGK